MRDVKHYQHSAEAIDKIKEITKSIDIGILCTNLVKCQLLLPDRYNYRVDF